VKTKLLVCTSANDAASAILASRRARRLAQILVANRIEATRISAVPCRLPNGQSISAAPSSQNGEIIRIVLEHEAQRMQ
jgi:hypothetical protein